METLHCPNCGETIPAEQINIQRMAAVCPNCAAVFEFEPPRAKAKRRKFKQPPRVREQTSDDTLVMSFRTNFRLSQDERVINSLVLGVVFMLAAGMMLALRRPQLIVMALFAFLLADAMFYSLLTRVFNRTQITMDETFIRVQRTPLPVMLAARTPVSLTNVSHITTEETVISQKEQYDLPRYRVFAVLEDGREQLIVNDLPEDYAQYVAQRLDAHLYSDAMPDDTDAGVDLSRLLDGDATDDSGDDASDDDDAAQMHHS